MSEPPVLEFERPILELERKIEELKQLRGTSVGFYGEVEKLEVKVNNLREETFAKLSPWQVVQLSRHPARPYSLDYIGFLMEEFVELHGDRLFADDPAIVGGVAYFDGRPILIVGHQKGRGTKENLSRNFGMARPEGYRKAKRLMELANDFGLPVVNLIDTPGAYPGIDAEERGQAEAIARNLEVMSGLRVPIVATVVGEGGSGGALALGVADRILMLQYSTYSVISPEGCASILWRDRAKAPEAAGAMKLRAEDLLLLKIADEVIPEPPGGAHRDPKTAAENLGIVLRRHLNEVCNLPTEILVKQRYQKYRQMGSFLER
ncbi:MAG: acetyl-CoA carboxylase carboxyltransferase subunit alpha [Pseudomonadota bacterium]